MSDVLKAVGVLAALIIGIPVFGVLFTLWLKWSLFLIDTFVK